LPPSPQIQKLADRSDVISEVPIKCSKILIFRGKAPDPAGGAYSAVYIFKTLLKTYMFD